MESIFPRRFRGQWEESAGYYWEGQAERLPFSLPIVHRELAISIFIGIASGGLSGGDSRVVASLLSTLYFFFFLLKRPHFYG